MVAVKIQDNAEVSWKNLDQVWDLVGDKEKFISYVQGETRAYLATGE